MDTFIFPSAPSACIEPVSRGRCLCSPTVSYNVLDHLGQGRYGSVVKCVRPHDMKTVAVKMIKNNSESIYSAKTEVAVMRKLRKLDADQCNFVQCNNIFLDKGHICLEYELLQESLLDFMKMRHYQPLPIYEIRPIIQQIAVSLHHLQNLRIVHADLKLDNIMLVNHPKMPYKVKLIDFGLATKVANAPVGCYTQTRYFRSPEVLLGFPITTAIDVWSLGCVAACLYLARALYQGATEYDMVQSIVAAQGPLPETMLRFGQKTKQYFWLDKVASCWKLNTPFQYQRQTGKTPSDLGVKRIPSLSHLLHVHPLKFQQGDDKAAELADRRMFVDLMKEMLQLDPAARITPLKIVDHQFCNLKHLDTFKPGAYVQMTKDIMGSFLNDNLVRDLSCPKPQLNTPATNLMRPTANTDMRDNATEKSTSMQRERNSLTSSQPRISDKERKRPSTNDTGVETENKRQKTQFPDTNALRAIQDQPPVTKIHQRVMQHPPASERLNSPKKCTSSPSKSFEKERKRQRSSSPTPVIEKKIQKILPGLSTSTVSHNKPLSSKSCKTVQHHPPSTSSFNSTTIKHSQPRVRQSADQQSNLGERKLFNSNMEPFISNHSGQMRVKQNTPTTSIDNERKRQRSNSPTPAKDKKLQKLLPGVSISTKSDNDHPSSKSQQAVKKHPPSTSSFNSTMSVRLNSPTISIENDRKRERSHSTVSEKQKKLDKSFPCLMAWMKTYNQTTSSKNQQTVTQHPPSTSSFNSTTIKDSQPRGRQSAEHQSNLGERKLLNSNVEQFISNHSGQTRVRQNTPTTSIDNERKRQRSNSPIPGKDQKQQKLLPGLSISIKSHKEHPSCKNNPTTSIENKRKRERSNSPVSGKQKKLEKTFPCLMAVMKTYNQTTSSKSQQPVRQHLPASTSSLWNQWKAKAGQNKTVKKSTSTQGEKRAHTSSQSRLYEKP